MSYSRFLASKYENAKTRKDKSLLVFAFSDFQGKKAKLRKKEGENTTYKICRIFAFHLSYFRFFGFEIQQCLNVRRRQSYTLLSLQSFTFSHWYIFALKILKSGNTEGRHRPFVRSHFRLLRRRSENATWRK
jgi:hypothetical protein